MPVVIQSPPQLLIRRRNVTINHWEPRLTYTTQEKYLIKRLKRTKKLFAFLRNHRHEIFDDAFQKELTSMYRDNGAGKVPIYPAMMAMAVLLQGYAGASDAEAVELTIVDLRWQLVLDRLGCTEPAFPQGALQQFRQRLIQNDMDRRILERTIEFAKKTKQFDWKKLPKNLRIAMDSSPLKGAGRVEDTINLLGHAAKNVVKNAAKLLQCDFSEVCRKAKIPVLMHKSIKAGLDRDWGDSFEKHDAINEIMKQVNSLIKWVQRTLVDKQQVPNELKDAIQTLKQIIDQDLEPDPSGNGTRIKQGVAKDRRISVTDPDMRHGRKSKSKTIKGYKRHIAVDIDSDLIVACANTPANQHDSIAAPFLKADIEQQNLKIGKLYIDHQYQTSPVIDEIVKLGGEVICRPRVVTNGEYFPKSYFGINIRDRVITCPMGQTQPITFGASVRFDGAKCNQCLLRGLCTAAATGKGRSISIAADEPRQKRLTKRIQTQKGRQEVRKRVTVEHKLAHISQRQGNRARYIGNRSNLFDLRRASIIQNLETIQMKKSRPVSITNELKKAA